MKRFVLISLALLLCMTAVMTGCKKMGEASYEAPSPGSDWYGKNDSESFYGDNMSTFEPKEPASQTDASDPFAGRKVIRNADLSVEALEFDKFMKAVTDKTNALGGYVQMNTVRESGRYDALRIADMTVRIPAEKLDEFLAEVDGMGNITTRNEQVDDVTETYVDLEARLSSLRTEYDTLLELLSKAESLQDVIVLQDRLSDVRYQIESYEARKRSYDSQIAFSTVHMSIYEVLRETPAEKESFGQEVSRRFSDSLSSVGDGLRAFAVWFLGDLPSILLTLIIMGLIALIVILIVRRCRKAAQKRREKAARIAAERAQQAAEARMAAGNAPEGNK